MAEKLMIVPPAHNSSSSESAPQDAAGHFSFNGASIIDGGTGFYTPIDPAGNSLSPMETGTDIVLPIIAQVKGRPNRHHAYFYEQHYLNGSPAERAIRYSRLQKVSWKAHRTYHQNYFGTLMPRDEAAASVAVILNSAGYIANLGVKIDEDGIAIEEITPLERNALRKPKVFSVERSLQRQGEMGKFVMDYALKQNFDHVKQAHIEEFLELTPRKMAYDEGLRARKLRLGLRLTDIALGVAVDPAEASYRTAHHNEALRKDMPSTAWQWAKRLIKGHEVDYLHILEDRLIDEYGFAA